MKKWKQKPGKSKVLEDGNIVLICGKGDRLIKGPVVLIGLGGICLLALKEWSLMKDTLLLSCACLVFLVFLWLRMYFEIYKIVILSRGGATIKIGRYEKFFGWNEFRVKRIEKPKKKYHLSEALFSVKTDTYRAKWMTATDFSAIYRPFTSFSVLLDYDWDFQHRSEWDGEHCRFSEPLFLKKMEEWGIKLTGSETDYSWRVSKDLW